jgi:hypothetical protein
MTFCRLRFNIGKNSTLTKRACYDGYQMKPRLLFPGHAHNDYNHNRPLLDALQAGFRSVEADVYLSGGTLCVAHDAKDIRPERTLSLLYLQPLWERHRTLPEGFQLLVDIKTNGEEVHAALKHEMRPFEPMFTQFKQGKVKKKNVTVILSGDRPRRVLEAENNRFVALDGRPEDLGQNISPTLMPLVSTSWFGAIKWFGSGEMPETERQKVVDLVTRTHAEGKTFRFWAAPDTPAGWEVQQKAGVDLINTDKLTELQDFYAKPRSR